MEPQGQVYRGLPLQTTGIFQSGFGFSALITGTIIEAAVVIDTDSGGGLENFTGPWLFGLNINGVPVLTTTERPSIDTGALASVKTGLSEAVTQGDWIEFYVDERVAGSIRGPITVWVRIQPTAKSSLANNDNFGIADSTDSNKLKGVLYSVLKSSLTTDIVNPAIAGLSWKQAVRVASAAAGTLATDFDNGSTVDGVAIATGDRILLKNQAAAAENGIYVVVASGAPTRATDADTATEILQASVYVQEGTANADKQFVLTTNAPITLGTTALVFAEFSSGGGVVDDTAYDATTWNGVTTIAPSKNAVRDKIEDILDGVTFTGDVVVPDEAYDATNWNASLEVPTKNAVRDKIESLGTGDVSTDAIWDAKGDLAAGTGANTAAKLTVGADGKFLKADSTQATGLLWETLAGGGDLLSTNNLSDVDDASISRTNLGLAIGTNVQAFDAFLDLIAALTDPGADKMLFWDESANAFAWLAPAANLSITGTDLDASGGGSGITRSVVESSGSFTAGATALTDYVYLLAGAHIPTMPTAVGNTNKYTFKNHHTARIAFSTTSSQTIDGSASTAFYIFPGEEIVLYSDGANWATSVRNKWRTIVKRVDEARVSTTTLANDAELELPMDAAGIYHARLKIYFQADTTPDFKFATTGPTAGGGGGALNSYWGYASSAGATAPTHTQGYVASTSILHSSYNFGHITIDFRILVGATPGTFALQFAQVTSSANDCYVMSPSTIEWLKVV